MYVLVDKKTGYQLGPITEQQLEMLKQYFDIMPADVPEAPTNLRSTAPPGFYRIENKPEDDKPLP